MSLTLGAGFVVTEPIRLGYDAYLACAKSLSLFCDEVVVICARPEEESARELEKIPNVRVIRTDTWPEDYDYNHMRDHFNMIFQYATSDVVLKIDSDCVFHPSTAPLVRSRILQAAMNNACTYIGRINYHGAGRVSVNHNSVLYAINLKMLRYDGIEMTISNESGSNQPVFSDHVDKCAIRDANIYPINYDCTFMTPSQVSYKWRSWYNAVFKTLGNGKHYDNDAEALKDFIAYHKKKSAHAKQAGLDIHHPDTLALIEGLHDTQWGYNNFQNIERD